MKFILSFYSFALFKPRGHFGYPFGVGVQFLPLSIVHSVCMFSPCALWVSSVLSGFCLKSRLISISKLSVSTFIFMVLFFYFFGKTSADDITEFHHRITSIMFSYSANFIFIFHIQISACISNNWFGLIWASMDSLLFYVSGIFL